jgi:ElaB/YqjD/DUF883 family membrane-anchored ribosome-binding protein
MGSGSDEVEQLRRQADRSREDLGQTVGALAYKADVKNRGKEALEDKKEALMEKVDEVKSKVPGVGNGSGDTYSGSADSGSSIKDRLPDGQAIKDKLPDGQAIKDKMPDREALKAKVPDSVGDAKARVAEATPSKEDVKQKAQAAADTAKDNPVALVAGAAAAGLAAGVAIPQTEIEKQKLGPKAQEARQNIETKVKGTVDQAKSSAQEAVQGVAGAVKEKGQEQGGKVGELAEKAADKTQERVG